MKHLPWYGVPDTLGPDPDAPIEVSVVASPLAHHPGLASAGQKIVAEVEFEALVAALGRDKAATEGLRPEHLPAIGRLHTQMVRHADDCLLTRRWHLEHWATLTPALVGPDERVTFLAYEYSPFNVAAVRVVDAATTLPAPSTIYVRALYTTESMLVPHPGIDANGCVDTTMTYGPFQVRDREYVQVVVENRGPAVALDVQLLTETGNSVLCEPITPKSRRFSIGPGQELLVANRVPWDSRPRRVRIQSDSQLDVLVEDMRCGNITYMQSGTPLPVELFYSGRDVSWQAARRGIDMMFALRNDGPFERHVEIEVQMQLCGEQL